MNRSLTLHPLSLVLGLVFAAICFVSMSQVFPAGQHVLVGYGPNARDYVQIQGTTPYVVPAGKVFVLTAIGSTSSVPAGGGCLIHLNVNGGCELTAAGSPSGETPSVKPTAAGFTAPAGSTINLSTDNGCDTYNPFLRCWGYLGPQ